MEMWYGHRSANTEPRTAMRIREHSHTLKHMLQGLGRHEVQGHKSAGPVQMFEAKQVLGCF